LENRAVLIKGRSNGFIEIRLADDIPYDKILEDFILKLSGTKGFLHGANPSVIIWGRNMQENEKTEMKFILDRDYDITNVKFSDELDEDEKSFIDKSQMDTPKVKLKKIMKLNSDVNKKVEREKVTEKESTPTFIMKTIRNGQRIEADADLTIVGDVNDGAEVYAVGNIIVFGQVRGLVHAGCNGNKSCIVGANKMIPKQIRIADMIVAFPKNRKPKVAEVARIEKDKIVVLPFRR